ncbi:MAG TPA: ABC transporter ATP-binding protein [Polyangiaceae bacterium LLY-WYZ-15_(1-7)]|nr:ABC transporter ATP-binding protein [Sandaracinus sp.]HJL03614.1 ABC transporter ATP-binding protein [Polyangiaceae bacterium LLY-WYZ-15_(1-7)]HJL12741.1 ABC transporter ATP-binding protein [Polyangiaceae bacterium LLY-WYZ-15_(1-7)]HJL33912.1 ABC transporter ATP-binding protein [Polyangiaceae bacterium LLY-WYZ-15_(1-7)]
MSAAAPTLRPGRLLGRVHELLGEPPSSEPLASDATDEIVGEEPLAELAERARRGGLHLERFEAPPSAALEGAGEGRPILTVGVDGQPLLLVDRAGLFVRVEDEDGQREWLDAVGLARRLGLAHAGVEHSWLALDARKVLELDLEPKASPWRKALMLIRTERKDLWAIVIYAMGVGVLSLALPLAVQTLVNTVAFGTLLQPILVLTLLLAGGLVFAAVLRGLQTWMVEIVQRRLFVRLVSELADRLPRVHVRAFERTHGPELVNRFFDVFLAQKAMSALLLGGIEALLTALAGLIVLSFYHPVLLGFGVAILLGAALVFVLLGKGAAYTTIKESKAKYAVAGWLEEMARHLFALKLAGGDDFARERLDRLSADWLRARAAHFRVVFRQIIGALALQVVVSAALLGLGGWLVVERELTIGQLVAAELIVTAVVASLSKLGGKLESAYDLVASADKLGVLLALPLEREGGEDPACAEPAARVELHELGSAGGELKDLELVIEPGRRVAIEGCRRGADALVDLLFGLREPSSGAVILDGQDLRDVRLAALRHRIAVVREPEVLPGSVGDNVRAVGRTVSASEIWEALADVGLAAEVRDLPQGLQTKLMPSGAPMTRLGALRLTLARALTARPALLVLDGVLDQLPPGDREELIARLGRNRTLLVVTHDPGVAALCDARVDLPERVS